MVILPAAGKTIGIIFSPKTENRGHPVHRRRIFWVILLAVGKKVQLFCSPQAFMPLAAAEKFRSCRSRQAKNFGHAARGRRKISNMPHAAGEKFRSCRSPQAKNFGHSARRRRKISVIPLAAGEKFRSFCSPQALFFSHCSLRAENCVTLLAAGKHFWHSPRCR